jgi:hypothetical protein
MAPRLARFLATALPLLTLPWTAAAFASVNISSAPAPPTNIEIDIIFPRNDTYARADSFPIVFAIQGNAAAYRMGGYLFTWIIRPYSPLMGTNAEFWIDYGQYFALDETSVEDPVLLVNRTLSLGAAASATDRQYELQWAFSFVPRCELLPNGTISENGTLPMLKENLVFTIDSKAKAPDVMAVTECPTLGTLIGVKSNVTAVEFDEPHCPVLGDIGVKADPCKVKLDEGLKRSIVSQLARFPTPTSTHTSTPTGTGTSDKKNSGDALAVRQSVIWLGFVLLGGILFTV